MPRLVFVPWESFSRRLPIQYLVPSDETIKENARNQATEWATIFQRRTGINLTDVERSEIDTVFEKLVRDHWSVSKVFEANLDLHELMGMINYWGTVSETGSSERKLPTGQAIFSFSVRPGKGVVFELLPPFITAFVEALHCAHSISDQGKTLKDVCPDDIVDTLHNIFECEGRPVITLDLMHWDYDMEFPKYSELESMVIALRQPREDGEESNASRSA